MVLAAWQGVPAPPALLRRCPLAGPLNFASPGKLNCLFPPRVSTACNGSLTTGEFGPSISPSVSFHACQDCNSSHKQRNLTGSRRQCSITRASSSTASFPSDGAGEVPSQGGPVSPPPLEQSALNGSSFPSTTSDGEYSEGSGSESEGSVQHGSERAPVTKPGEESWYSLPTVPWGTGKIVQVMVLWLLAYIIIGQVAMPMCLTLLGKNADDLSIRGHALMHLCLDVAQLGVTLLILWSCLKQFRPRRRGLFPIKWKGSWWLVVLVLACPVFPLVDWVAVQSLGWFPLEFGEALASQIEASLSMGDWVTNTAYFSIVSICAPIWEEAIFRGFLLTSLARYMSPAMAVGVSSLLFAMCHFRLQTFLPLLLLGVVFSAVFIVTKNLLPPIVLHSLWNVFVLLNLLMRPMAS